MSSLEWKFFVIWNNDIKDLPFHQELAIIPNRKFRYDFAWPDLKVVLELDGGIWSGGGHTTGSGKTRDCEKDWLAFVNGWTVIRWTPNMITSKNIRTLADKLSCKKILQSTAT